MKTIGVLGALALGLFASAALAQTAAPPPNWVPAPAPAPLPSPSVVAPRIIVPPAQNCQSAAQASWVTFQWHEAQQLCSQNPWSNRPVRCVESLQSFSIPVWQAVNVCVSAR